jgi:pimeloyl-ACP methyl ester carboxylesterase
MQFAIRHPRRCSALVLIVPAAFAPAGAGLHPRSASLVQFLAGTILDRRQLELPAGDN